MKVVLFTQPLDKQPMVNLDALRKGVYHIALTASEILYFTDIGRAVWEACVQMDPKAHISLASKDPQPWVWNVCVRTRSLIIMLKNRPYKGMTSSAINHFVAIECKGSLEACSALARGVVTALDRTPWEMDGWKKFEKRTGVSQEEVIRRWRRLLEYNPKETTESPEPHLKEQAESSIKMAEQVVKGSLEYGADVHTAENLLNIARANMAQGSFKAALYHADLARKSAQDARYKRQQLMDLHKHSTDLILSVRSALEEAEALDLQFGDARAVLAMAESSLARGDYRKAIEYASRARRTVDEARYRHQQALELIKSTRSQIADARLLGIDVTRAEDALEQAELALETNDFAGVSQGALQAQAIIDGQIKARKQMLSLHQRAEDSVASSRALLVEMKRIGLRPHHLEVLLGEAEEALLRNEYRAATELAEKVYAQSKRLGAQYTEAVEIVETLKRQLQEAANYIAVEAFQKEVDLLMEQVREGEIEEPLDHLRAIPPHIESQLSRAQPAFEVAVHLSEMAVDVWSRVPVTVRNTGAAHAKDLVVQIEGMVDHMSSPPLPFLQAGKESRIELAVKPLEPGELPVKVVVRGVRAFDGAPMESTFDLWIKTTTGDVPEVEVVEEGLEEEVLELSDKELEEVADGLEPSITYLLTGDPPVGVYTVLARLISKGFSGICVTREYPPRLAKQYPLDGCRMVWLSNVEHKDAVRPSNLEKVNYIVRGFLSEEGEGVVAVDGLEYLMIHNGFTNALKFIQSLRDQCAMEGKVLLLAVSPSAFEPGQFTLISREVDEEIPMQRGVEGPEAK